MKQKENLRKIEYWREIEIRGKNESRMIRDGYQSISSDEEIKKVMKVVMKLK